MYFEPIVACYSIYCHWMVFYHVLPAVFSVDDLILYCNKIIFN